MASAWPQRGSGTLRVLHSVRLLESGINYWVVILECNQNKQGEWGVRKTAVRMDPPVLALLLSCGAPPTKAESCSGYFFLPSQPPLALSPRVICWKYAAGTGRGCMNSPLVWRAGFSA